MPRRKKILSRPPRPPKIKEINSRSYALLQEFREHAADVLKSMKRRGEIDPDEPPDWGKLYEGWSVQKISSLQLYVEHYERMFIYLPCPRRCSGTVDKQTSKPQARPKWSLIAVSSCSGQCQCSRGSRNH